MFRQLQFQFHLLHFGIYLKCSSFHPRSQNWKEYASFSCYDTLSRSVPLHYLTLILSLHFQCIQSVHCQLRFGLIHTDLLRSGLRRTDLLILRTIFIDVDILSNILLYLLNLLMIGRKGGLFKIRKYCAQIMGNVYDNKLLHTIFEKRIVYEIS